MGDFLLAGLVVGVLLVALVLWLVRRRRSQLGMPHGERIYSDTNEQPGKTIVSHRYKLKGKPDYLIRDGSMIIPVEMKTGRTPRSPFASHIMQLIAYCLLVADKYETRPQYGVIRYPHGQFKIEFTREREQDLLALLEEMRMKRNLPEVHRNHMNLWTCTRCNFHNICEERIEE